MKRRWNQGRDAHIHFFRDKHGSEVDLLITQGSDLVAVEIKSAKTFHSSHLKGLKHFRILVSNREVISYLAYTGEERGSASEVELIGLNDIETLLNWRRLFADECEFHPVRLHASEFFGSLTA